MNWGRTISSPFTRNGNGLCIQRRPSATRIAKQHPSVRAPSAFKPRDIYSLNGVSYICSKCLNRQIYAMLQALRRIGVLLCETNPHVKCTKDTTDARLRTTWRSWFWGAPHLKFWGRKLRIYQSMHNEVGIEISAWIRWNCFNNASWWFPPMLRQLSGFPRRCNEYHPCKRQRYLEKFLRNPYGLCFLISVPSGESPRCIVHVSLD